MKKSICINSKSTAKGIWSLDITAEINGEDVTASNISCDFKTLDETEIIQ